MPWGGAARLLAETQRSNTDFPDCRLGMALSSWSSQLSDASCYPLSSSIHAFDATSIWLCEVQARKKSRAGCRQLTTVFGYVLPHAVHIRSGCNKMAHDREVLFLRSMMERRSAQVVEGIDGIAFLQQLFHLVEVAVAGGEA